MKKSVTPNNLFLQADFPEWALTLQRLQASFPIAGSVPCAMRNPDVALTLTLTKTT